MKKAVWMIVLPLVLSCSAFYGGSDGCGLTEEDNQTWVEFHPTHEEKQRYVSSILTYDPHYKPESPTYFYKGNNSIVYVCSSALTAWQKRNMPAGCFTFSYFLRQSEEGIYFVFDSQEIVCTG